MKGRGCCLDGYHGDRVGDNCIVNKCIALAVVASSLGRCSLREREKYVFLFTFYNTTATIACVWTCVSRPPSIIQPG